MFYYYLIDGRHFGSFIQQQLYHFYVSHLGSLYKGCFAILWVQIKRFARLIRLVFKVTKTHVKKSSICPVYIKNVLKKTQLQKLIRKCFSFHNQPFVSKYLHVTQPSKGCTHYLLIKEWSNCFQNQIKRKKKRPQFSTVLGKSKMWSEQLTHSSKRKKIPRSDGLQTRRYPRALQSPSLVQTTLPKSLVDEMGLYYQCFHKSALFMKDSCNFTSEFQIYFPYEQLLHRRPNIITKVLHSFILFTWSKTD